MPRPPHPPNVHRLQWKWANVPVPAQHVVGLTLGAVLHLRYRRRLFPWRGMGPALGLPVVALSVALAAWSVAEAGNARIEPPDRLLIHGPYALSRNPMYVAWTLLHLGVGLAADSLWIVALTPIATAYTHVVDVREEERYLEERFGDEYRDYAGRVGRYL